MIVFIGFIELHVWRDRADHHRQGVVAVVLVNIIDAYVMFDSLSLKLEAQRFSFVVVYILVEQLKLDCVFNFKVAEHDSQSLTLCEKLAYSLHRRTHLIERRRVLRLLNDACLSTFAFIRFDVVCVCHYDLSSLVYFDCIRNLLLLFFLFFILSDLKTLTNLVGSAINMLTFVNFFINAINLAEGARIFANLLTFFFLTEP